MSAPTWLPILLSALMIDVAAYSLWRLALARSLDRTTDLEVDLLHALLALAVTAMLVHWLDAVPRALWTGLVAAAACRFGWRAFAAPRRSGGRLSRPAAESLAACAVAGYMLLAGVAPSALSGSTAGMYVMAGMPGMMRDTSIGLPSLGLLIAVALAGYGAVVVRRVSDPVPGSGIRGGTPFLAPRSVDACRVLLVLTMAYAILARLV